MTDREKLAIIDIIDYCPYCKKQICKTECVQQVLKYNKVKPPSIFGRFLHRIHTYFKFYRQRVYPYFTLYGKYNEKWYKRATLDIEYKELQQVYVNKYSAFFDLHEANFIIVGVRLSASPNYSKKREIVPIYKLSQFQLTIYQNVEYPYEMSFTQKGMMIHAEESL
jgi:hypothetical protein